MNRTSQFVEVRIHSIIIDVTHEQYTHTVSRHGTVGRVRATCNLGTQFNASKSKVLFQLPVDTLLEFTLSYLEARPRARYFSVFRFNLCKRSAQPSCTAARAPSPRRRQPRLMRVHASSSPSCHRKAISIMYHHQLLSRISTSIVCVVFAVVS